MNSSSGMNNTQISASQLSKMLFLYSLGTAVLIMPTMVTIVAKQDSWVSMMLVMFLQLLVPLLYVALSDRFPHLSIAEYSQKIVGKWGGKLISLLFVFYFLVLSSLVLRNISDFLNLSVLPATPTWFINVTFMLIVIYGVFLGGETVARLSELLSFWLIFVIIIVVVALFNKFDIHRFEPVLYDGWLPVFRGAYLMLGFPVAEYVFLTVLLPMVKIEERVKLKKSMAWTVIIIGVTSLVLVLLLQGVLGIYETSRSQFAIFDMAKNINVEEILVRVEVLVAIVWICSAFIKLVLCVYTLCLLTTQFLGLQSYRTLIVSYAFLIVGITSQIYRNIGHAKQFSLHVWSTYSVLQALVLPLLLYIAAVLMGKKYVDNGPNGSDQMQNQASSNQKQQTEKPQDGESGNGKSEKDNAQNKESQNKQPQNQQPQNKQPSNGQPQLGSN